MSQLTKTRDIIWLAGLLEGEGCFRLNAGKWPSITLGMCDEDIVVKVATIMRSNATHYSNIWATQLSGARAIEWMMTLYPLLGKRRRASISEVIGFWKRTKYKAPHGMRSMATCHPDRVNHAFSLCHPCYNKQYKKKQLLESRGQR